MNKQTKTHFGYKQVPVEEKQKKVTAVFDSVAAKYNIMNDLMSAGIHRIWKRKTVHLANIRPGMKILDLASGTADLVKLMAPKVGNKGSVIASDINQSMLTIGKQHLIDANIIHNVNFAIANAESLCFKENFFDRITIAFGLRNVTDKQTALINIFKCLKPGGMLLILEFSKPVLPLLNALYDLYSFNLLPKIGKWIANDEDSYQYLAESIRVHPDQETLRTMCLGAGFDECNYLNFSGGIVALHRAFKY